MIQKKREKGRVAMMMATEMSVKAIAQNAGSSTRLAATDVMSRMMMTGMMKTGMRRWNYKRRRRRRRKRKKGMHVRAENKAEVTNVITSDS